MSDQLVMFILSGMGTAIVGVFGINTYYAKRDRETMEKNSNIALDLCKQELTENKKERKEERLEYLKRLDKFDKSLRENTEVLKEVSEGVKDIKEVKEDVEYIKEKLNINQAL
ncbi:hypothetical protein [Clostridium senegalense]